MILYSGMIAWNTCKNSKDVWIKKMYLREHTIRSCISISIRYRYHNLLHEIKITFSWSVDTRLFQTFRVLGPKRKRKIRRRKGLGKTKTTRKSVKYEKFLIFIHFLECVHTWYLIKGPRAIVIESSLDRNTLESECFWGR